MDNIWCIPLIILRQLYLIQLGIFHKKLNFKFYKGPGIILWVEQITKEKVARIFINNFKTCWKKLAYTFNMLTPHFICLKEKTNIFIWQVHFKSPKFGFACPQKLYKILWQVSFEKYLLWQQVEQKILCDVKFI